MIAMRDTPKGWQRFNTGIFYKDPARAIDWLCAAFGFEVRIKVEGEGGRIEHSELTYGDGLIMVGGDAEAKGKHPFRRSPKDVGGGNTQSVMVFVDDCDAHCAHARSHGAEIVMEPETHDFGADYWTDRTYEAIDLEGHHWWFTQRMRG
jgi:uncharacterized glyoxalase superfamily protein PhnB